MKKGTYNKKLHLSPALKKLVESVGYLSQSMGVGRIIGQIYALCYFTKKPLSFAEIQNALGISKGSASMGLRQLKKWGALVNVIKQRDRKGYYEASESFGKIIKSLVIYIIGKRMSSSSAIIEEAQDFLKKQVILNKKLSAKEIFIQNRISILADFQNKIKNLWNEVLPKIF